MQATDNNDYRAQSRGEPWGWALGCSLAAHAGAIVVLGVCLKAPLPPMPLPESIRVDLISLPAASKAPERAPAPPIKREAERPQPVKEMAPPPKPVKAKKTEPTVVKKVQPLATMDRPQKQAAESQPIDTKKAFDPDQTGSRDSPETESPAQPTAQTTSSLSQTPAAATSQEVITQYANLIRARIDKVKRYPLMARKAGKQGSVIVEFSVDRTGDILKSSIAASCGIKALDRAALKALKRAGPFAPLPNSLNSPHIFNVQINFFLAR